MELRVWKEEVAMPPRVILRGDEALHLTAGEQLQIRYKTPTVEMLLAEVPAGKTWDIAVSVVITQLDA